MTKKMTYDELNELTHQVADKIDEAIKDDVDRCNVNDILSAYLQGLGIEFVDDEDDEE